MFGDSGDLRRFGAATKTGGRGTQGRSLGKTRETAAEMQGLAVRLEKWANRYYFQFRKTQLPPWLV